MSALLIELWQGTLTPTREKGENSEELHHLQKLLSENRAKLQLGLNEEQLQWEERCFECAEEMLSLVQEDAFCIGFRLGARLSAEALLSK